MLVELHLYIQCFWIACRITSTPALVFCGLLLFMVHMMQLITQSLCCVAEIPSSSWALVSTVWMRLTGWWDYSWSASRELRQFLPLISDASWRSPPHHDKISSTSARAGSHNSVLATSTTMYASILIIRMKIRKTTVTVGRRITTKMIWCFSCQTSTTMMVELLMAGLMKRSRPSVHQHGMAVSHRYLEILCFQDLMTTVVMDIRAIVAVLAVQTVSCWPVSRQCQVCSNHNVVKSICLGISNLAVFCQL